MKNIFIRNKKPKKEVMIGIDLGTTNSCVAIIKNGKPFIIPDDNGNTTTPSIVSIQNSKVYIGRNALFNSFTEVKRLIGLNYESDEISKEKKYSSFNIVKKDNGVGISSFAEPNNIYSPEEISSFILHEMKCIAEKYLKKKITKAVVTVPAYFNENQRKSTIDAGKIIGLEIVRIINEPTSAAIAYSIDKTTISKKIIVYDIGGGTLDVSLLDVSNGIILTQGTFGNTHLGGSDFDKELMEYCIDTFSKMNELKLQIYDLSNDILTILKTKCENAKKELTTKISTLIIIENFFNNKNLFIPLTRDTMEHIFSSLIMLCIKPIQELFDICKIKKDEIDEIIMVGGMSRLPILRQSIKNYFNKEPNISLNPDEIVAAGASIVAQRIIDPQSIINNNEDITIIDTIPLSLGVSSLGKMSFVINRGSTIPISKTKIYGKENIKDTETLIQIYEGENLLVKNNFHIGEFVLSVKEEELNKIAENIKNSERNISDHIEITFSIDKNGMVNVSAKSLLYGKMKSVSLTTNGCLNEEQLRLIINKSKKLIIVDKQEIKLLSAKQSIIFFLNILKDRGVNIEDIKIPTTLKKIEKLFFELNEKHSDILNKTQKEKEKEFSNDFSNILMELDKDNIVENENYLKISLACAYISSINISDPKIEELKTWANDQHSEKEWESKISEVELYCDKIGKTHIKKILAKTKIDELKTLLTTNKDSQLYEEYMIWTSIIDVETENELINPEYILSECSRKIELLKQ